MPHTFDIEDITARVTSAGLPYEIRLDVLNLLDLVRSSRSHAIRHYHALEDIAEGWRDEGEPDKADELLDAAENMYSDLYPPSPYSSTERLREAIIKARGGEAPVSMVAFA